VPVAFIAASSAIYVRHRQCGPHRRRNLPDVKNKRLDSQANIEAVVEAIGGAVKARGDEVEANYF